MSDILHITNGDSSVTLLQAGGIQGDILPWRDVLHDGPVPANLSLQELSQVRAGFIVRQGWGDFDRIAADFAERDGLLGKFKQYRKVLLWFEHDLYDQLQILQILDWLATQDLTGTDAGLICTEQYLGWQTPESIVGLQRFEQAIDIRHLGLATKAWWAFRQPDPSEFVQLLAAETDALPFLQGAVLRMLEEYPDITTGLGRTETQAVTLLGQNARPGGQLFGDNQKLESRIFLGDSSFWALLNGLLSAPEPLIEFQSARDKQKKISTEDKSRTLPLRITNTGIRVLSGKENYLDIASPSRWIGGVNLHPGYYWCWNSATQTIEQRT